MRGPTWPVAALVGVLVAAAVAEVALSWAALSIGSGALASVLAVVLLGEGRRYYSAAGSAFCVVLGAGCLAGLVAVGTPTATGLVLLALGLPSAALVAAIYGGGRLVERYARRRDAAGAMTLLSRATSAVRLVRLARSAFTLGRAALYVGVVVLAGVAGFVLGGLGVTVPIPWPGPGRVDAVLVAFVAAVLVGFHGLAAAHVTWRTARGLATTGRDAGRRVAAGRRSGGVESGGEGSGGEGSGGEESGGEEDTDREPTVRED